MGSIPVEFKSLAQIAKPAELHTAGILTTAESKSKKTNYKPASNPHTKDWQAKPPGWRAKRSQPPKMASEAKPHQTMA